VNNLFVEYLVVIDSSVYNVFKSLYGNLNPSLMNQYINIFFSQIVNGVRQFIIFLKNSIFQNYFHISR
jgi:hypothetical protein